MNTILSSWRKPCTTGRHFKPVIIFHDQLGYGHNDPNVCINNINAHEYSTYSMRVKEMLSINCQKWQPKEQNNCNPQSLPSPSESDSMDQSPPDSPPASKPPKRKRGNLPKQTTALLKSWLAEHKKHPYPTEEQKLFLVRKTGLSLQQISNWFINARRRHLPNLLKGQPMKNNHGYPPYADIPSDHSDNTSDMCQRNNRKCTRINKNGCIKKPYPQKRKSSY
ncbi:822_t:CDS:2 [Ambispora gerdemannii]|uniref:822_t:CDS:1 n=1 Tax=Ambispora gerdemannii TaxID=144530 RepID=A0A9N9AWQ2_9GLOM|nr:822_t:CDS:2 [Ambispora gerdemannii]